MFKTRRAVSAAALLFCTGLAVPVMPAMAMDAASQPTPLAVKSVQGHTIVSVDGVELTSTPLAVRSARLMPIAGSPVKLALWDEVEVDGSTHAKFSVSLDGRTYSDVYENDNLVHLRYADFDPVGGAAGGGGEPMVATDLEGAATTKIFIVQFVATPLDIFRAQIEAAGGVVYNYMPSNGYLCKLDGRALAVVKSLPYVRWVGVYQPAYRIDEQIVDAHFGRPGQVTGSPFGRDAVAPNIGDLDFAAGIPATFNIQVFERGPAQKQIVADAIRALGGTIQSMIPDGFLLQARLTKDQLAAIARMDEVLFIDPWTPNEADMNNIRALGGANFIQTTLGMTGQGVRGEVMDGNVLNSHLDMAAAPTMLFHGSRSGDASHGTSTTGIVFGRGVSQANGKGMLPGAEQPIFADYDLLSNRYTHTSQLVDPTGPYRAVFQSNSWGGGLTTSYTSTSNEMDDILFRNDFCLLNSQSNAGSTQSRPQAWAKNVVSIGGIVHNNNQSWTDDRWAGGASTGPAADGRIKPDLSSMFDSVYSPYSSSTTAYTQFGGTSAATPIVAGHFGIMFQMWHQGAFAGFGGGASVFASRPHMTTAKALMINTARQWDMAISGTDITRVRQGWGHPDLARLLSMASKMFIVNETDVLTALQTKQYKIQVLAGEPSLKATMTYADRPGTTSASQHRINLLTLKVTNPAGSTFYWGNNGMTTTGMWSTSGGSANTKDTVQNVYIQNPTAGQWTVEVRADALPQDGRTETVGVTDADFALVVTGGTLASACRVDLNGDGLVDFADYLDFLTRFDAQDLRVDFTGDGVVDFSDYLEFLNLFETGC